MSDPSDPRHDLEAQLRPVVARLQEIHKKCRSMGTRSEEFPEMALRVERVLSALTSGQDEHGRPVRYGAIARELFPVARAFETAGLMGVGREVGHVERALLDLAGDDEPSGPEAFAAAASSARIEPSPADDIDDQTADAEPVEEAPPRFAPTRPILATLGIAVVAVAVCIWIIVRHDPLASLPEPTAIPVLAPTAPPAPTPTPRRLTPDEQQQRADRKRLMDAVSAARLALVEGDLETALDRLDEAASIDTTPGAVVETAEEALRQLLQLAMAAAADTRWEEAASRVSQARALALRFGLEERVIREAEAAIAGMPRFRRFGPADGQRLASEVGRRIEVYLRDDSVIEGVLVRVDSGQLVVSKEDEIGRSGGRIHYEEEILFTEVREIRVPD